jgi:hypothetical protein
MRWFAERQRGQHFIGGFLAPAMLGKLPERSSATRIRLACPRKFPMDLLVRSPAEIRRRIKIGDPFVSEITTKGIVLHEANHARVG